MKFNENLKYLRKREGLTQEELAEKLNVSRQSVTKWESGQSLPDIEKVKEIAYIFSYLQKFKMKIQCMYLQDL